jgi:hypothetical protein
MIAANAIANSAANTSGCTGANLCTFLKISAPSCRRLKGNRNSTGRIKVAAVPLKLTLVAPVRLVPRILMADPRCQRQALSPQTGPDQQPD